MLQFEYIVRLLLSSVSTFFPESTLWLLQQGADPNLTVENVIEQSIIPFIFSCCKTQDRSTTQGFYSSDHRHFETIWFDHQDAQNRILQFFCCCPNANLQQPMIRPRKTPSLNEEKPQTNTQETPQGKEAVSLLQYCIEQGRSNLVWLLALDYCFKQTLNKLTDHNYADFSPESVKKLVEFTTKLFNAKIPEPDLARAYFAILRILSQITLKKSPQQIFMDLRQEIVLQDNTSSSCIEDLDVIYARGYLANYPDISFEQLFCHLQDCVLNGVEARNLSIRVWREEHPECSMQELANNVNLPFKSKNSGSFVGWLVGRAFPK